MKKLLRVAAARLLVLALVTLSGAGAHGAEETSRANIESFHATLLSVMRNAKTLKFSGRYARLGPVIERQFHLPLMTGIASGAHWRQADETQKRKLINAFKRMSVGTYAARFDGFSGQSFKTLSVVPGPRKTVLVKTQINRPGDSPVKITYVTKKFGARWRIVDILLAGGISELAVRRSEFRQVLKTDGVDGLIKTLNERADQLKRD